MTVTVWTQALRAASTAWYDQADDLRAAARSLLADEIRPELLGSRVTPHATSFLDHWRGRVEELRDLADRHGEELATAAQQWIATDQAAVDQLRTLLPWSQRDVPGPGQAPYAPYGGTP